MKKFNDRLTKELFEQIKAGKSEGKGLIDLFYEFSIKNDMAMGSVRNHYYKIMKTSKNNCKLKKVLNLSDDMFPELIKEFSISEERELLKKILISTTNGKSVRKSILDISNGREKLNLRNLNKYRNLLKNKPELVMEVVDEIKREKGRCKNPYESNIKKDLREKLKDSVDNLIVKIYGQILEENEVFKGEISKLKEENEKLKQILKHNIENKSYLKEFFTKNNKNNASNDCNNA